MKPKPFNFLPLAALLGLLLILAGCDPTDPRGESLKDLQGKWLVINYWAVWCKPCIEEIPELNSFAHQYSQQARVFGVDFDDNQDDQLAEAITQLDIAFPVLATDPASQLGYERPSVLPTTVLINAQGKLHRILVGPQTATSLAQAMEP